MSAFDIVTIQPPDYPHWRAFDEVRESIGFGLEQLGHTVTSRVNQLAQGVPAVLFGANLLSPEQIRSLPQSVIIYNLEQVDAGSPWFSADRFSALASRQVFWDYSRRNLDNWAEAGIERGVHVPIGYAPILTRIDAGKRDDIDVLFYGSLNPRRQVVLDQLKQAGLNVHELFGRYGAERDKMIAQAKLVLNVHFYPTSILEVVRISYLLANRVAVLSEREPHTEVETDLEDACAWAPYAELTALAGRLVRDHAARRQLGDSGFDAIRRRSVVEILDQALDRTRAAEERR